MIGRTYLERGAPVVVVARWGDVKWRLLHVGIPIRLLAEGLPKAPKGAPRNVRIRHADGSLTIRPFRGLRKIKVPEPDRLRPAPGEGAGDAGGGRR